MEILLKKEKELRKEIRDDFKIIIEKINNDFEQIIKAKSNNS